MEVEPGISLVALFYRDPAINRHSCAAKNVSTIPIPTGSKVANAVHLRLLVSL
jgi:hypothetical protein